MLQAFENHIQWPAVKEAHSRLQAAGFEAYLAGGCVRDLLMGREPNDFDLATDAKPDQVEQLFPNAITVGRAFGVTIVPHSGFQLEIATFRRDGDYKDGRRPDSVIFSNAEEDAKRRDFTVNALFLDLATGQVLDFVEGRKDIQAKLLRAVGDADRRFQEDKLRLLRAVRFAAQLEFTIEPGTWSALARFASEIHLVSRERIRDELLKLMAASDRSRGLDLLAEAGLLKALFPRLAQAQAAVDKRLTVSRTTETAPVGAMAAQLPVLQKSWSAPKLFMRAAASNEFSVLARRTPPVWLLIFLWPILEEGRVLGQGPNAADIRGPVVDELKKLKLDNATIDQITWVWRHWARFFQPEKLETLERMMILMSPHIFIGFAFAELFSRDDVEKQWRADLLQFQERGGVLGQKTPAWVTGADLKVLGIPAGVEMGRFLQEAYSRQISGVWASRDDVQPWLQTLVKK